MQTPSSVTAGTAMGQRQQRSETASELGIVLKGPDGAMIRVTVEGKQTHRGTAGTCCTVTLLHAKKIPKQVKI